jgi:hypothetical protein
MGIRSHRLAVARIVLALMLFAQGVMAWSACDLPEHSPVRAVRASAEVAPCHQSGFGGACLAYCLSDRQAVKKVGMDIPAMPAAPVLTLALQVEPSQSFGVAYVSLSAPGSGPPRRILLQSFQI